MRAGVLARRTEAEASERPIGGSVGPPRGRPHHVVSGEGGEDQRMKWAKLVNRPRNITGKGNDQGNQEGKRPTTSSSARNVANKRRKEKKGLVKSSTIP